MVSSEMDGGTVNLKNGSVQKNGKVQDGRAEQVALARIEQAMRAAAAGDFTVRLPNRRKDGVGRVEAAFNQLVARNAALEAELVRLGQILGREGRMTELAQ